MPEELSRLKPKNTVIYEMPNRDGYYGFTDNGTRVEDIIPETCCDDIIMENYREHGVVYAFSRWLQDFKDAFPDEFKSYGDFKSFSDLYDTHYDEIYDLRKRFLYDNLGFTIQPDPNYFDLNATGVDEVKAAMLQSLKKGVAIYDLDFYAKYLRESGKITGGEYQELYRWYMGENYHKFKKYQDKYKEVNDASDEEEEEDDIMSSTKITANTSAGKPKNLIVYKTIDGYYEGYTDRGTKVTDEGWEYCCRDIIITNYAESGMDYNTAYFKFWLDVRNFFPEAFDKLCEENGGVDLNDLEHDPNFDEMLQYTDELYDLCYDYITEVGFHTELDPKVFPMNVTSEEELKTILKKLMLAGAENDILDEYLKRLHYMAHVLDWGQYASMCTWLNQRFNSRSFSNKVADIAREMWDNEEEDDIMSSTKITANYNFNYGVTGKAEVLEEVKNAIKHGTSAKDLGWFLDWMCFEENRLTLDDYDDIIDYIRRFNRNWYQEKFKQYEEEDDVEEEDDILGSTKIYSTMTFPEAQVLIRRKFLSGANYLDMIRYIRNLLSSNQIDQSLYSQIHKWLDNEARDLRRGHKLMVDLLENADDDEEDVMLSTKVTATTNSAGTPNEPVIYEKAGQQGFYGYSNGGKRVTGSSWDRCAMNIVIQNYMESGMSEDDARYQFWQDVKDFNPEGMEQRLGGDLDVRSEEFEYLRGEGLLNQLRFDYLAEGLGFYDELDQNIFDYTVSTMEEIKASIKKAMLAGATPNQYFDYFNYLVNDGVITLDEYDELSNYIETKFEDSGFRIKNYARVYENSSDEDEEDDITTATKIKENKIMGRKFTKKPRYFANMVSADTNIPDTRLVGLWDGYGMGGYLYIFSTNVPESRLAELENECKSYDVDDMPIWADVLEEEGYIFEAVDSCENVTPYTTSTEWLEEYYPEVKEIYYINCD